MQRYHNAEVTHLFSCTDITEHTSHPAVLLQRYRSEVFNAQLVFISFLNSQSAEGGLVPNLRAAGHRPLQFRLDRERPDLTKLDSILGHLAAAGANFNEQLAATEAEIKEKGLQTVFEEVALKMGPGPGP